MNRAPNEKGRPRRTAPMPRYRVPAPRQSASVVSSTDPAAPWQVRRLAARFGLTPAVAAVVAGHLFGEAAGHA